MFHKRRKLPVTILIICLISLLGFKDTGIFVKEYVSNKENGSQVTFNKEESVNVLREGEEVYVVEKDGVAHQIPKEVMIRTSRSSQNFKIIKDTNLLDKPMGNTIAKLTLGEIVRAERYEKDYGLFRTEDGKSGYIKLDDLEVIKNESLTYGISTVDKVLKSGDLYYVISKGEMVAIKSYDKDFIIVDYKGNEFIAKENYIDLKSTKLTASRSVISRRSASISAVIQNAYNALGKPYVSADTGKRGYDCSGLTYSVYLNGLGIQLPRSSSDQVNSGIEVDKSELIPGDLLFFNTSGNGISHVGLYVGDGNMIHASTGQRKVIVTEVDSTYYKNRYVTARRIISR